MKPHYSHPFSEPQTRRAFTLVELLVTIAIVSVLTTISFVAFSKMKLSARQVGCTSNMRQIGTAILMYAGENGDRLPETTHTASVGDSWISTIAPYLNNVDDVRICPADPRGDERLAAGGTSYTLNSFLFVPEVGPFGEIRGVPLNHLGRIPSPTRTIMLFNVSDDVGTGPTGDHTHSNRWKNNWSAVVRDIEPNRFRRGDSNAQHTNGSANYLFVDGHVENRSATEMREKILSGTNIAEPPE